MTNTAKATIGTASRTLVLFLLVVVYTFNFLDRQILAILSPAIQKELGLSDSQLGLMRGVSFAIFYSTLGVPIAYMADRMSRTWIMTIALTVWSAMTALCGLATNFWQLFFSRMMVGVGEAGGVAPAYSLISDYFEPEKRARALAIYSFGIPIGSAVGIIFGAVITTILDWRAAFIIVGIMGVILAPIFRFLIKEPKRGAFDGAKADTKPAKIGEVLKLLMSKPSFWTLSIGASCSSMMGYGLFAWLPTFFLRSYGDVLPQALAWVPDFLIPPNPKPLLYAGYYYGLMVLIGGVIGIWLGGQISDKIGKAKKSAYALVPAASFLLAMPFFILGTFTNNLMLSFFVYIIPTALGLVWLGPVLSAFQNIVPPNMRATASAIFLLINNLIGIGLGDFLIGLMSDTLKAQYGAESLRYSIMSGTVFYVLAAILLFFASKTLEKDWES